VYTPRLHAKLLAWDDDALAITSQNWLSADPSDNAPLREIGVFINAPKVADQVIRLFQLQLSR
jgi:cardiolipin synthase